MTTYRMAQLPGLLGSDVGTTGFQTVTQNDIDAFADVTRDHQWIHVDAARAATGPFGTTIAHGFLTLSLVGGFWTELFHVEDATVLVNYGLDRVRFVSPVPVGARVRMRARIEDVVAVTGGYRLRVDQAIEIEGADKPALVALSIYEFRGSTNG